MQEYKHISDLTLREVQRLIDDAYKEGFESDDGFLLACSVRTD